MCKAQPMQSRHELINAVKKRNYSYDLNLSQKSEPYLCVKIRPQKIINGVIHILVATFKLLSWTMCMRAL